MSGSPEPRLKARYTNEVLPKLKAEFGMKSPMRAPRLEKIVINMGVGRATQQASLIEGAQRDLERIPFRVCAVRAACRNDGSELARVLPRRGARKGAGPERCVAVGLWRD